MIEESRVPHKLSVARACRRVAAMFRRWSDPPTMTDDYRRATADRNGSEQALQREELAGEALRDLGGDI
jgi:hypothetical protein